MQIIFSFENKMSTSRQVIKKRSGSTVKPIKRKHFKTTMFFDSELKRLDNMLDRNDLDLNGE